MNTRTLQNIAGSSSKINLVMWSTICLVRNNIIIDLIIFTSNNLYKMLICLTIWIRRRVHRINKICHKSFGEEIKRHLKLFQLSDRTHLVLGVLWRKFFLSTYLQKQCWRLGCQHNFFWKDYQEKIWWCNFVHIVMFKENDSYIS